MKQLDNKSGIEILDTTLRDGEQTAGVSFNVSEKLAIAGLLLDELHVDRIEVASTRVSKGESEALATVCDWAASKGYLDKVEALGFVDGGVSVDWIADGGGKVINILAKGSLRHLTKQLCKTPEQHIADIAKVLDRAQARGVSANIYLEDWSNGIANSQEYVFMLIDALKDMPIRRFLLPDTLGVQNPWSAYGQCIKMRECFPDLHFDYHGHNDYAMAVANTLAAVKAGARMVVTGGLAGLQRGGDYESPIAKALPVKLESPWKAPAGGNVFRRDYGKGKIAVIVSAPKPKEIQ